MAGQSCRGTGAGDRLSSGKNTEGSGTAMTARVTAGSHQEETVSEDHAGLSPQDNVTIGMHQKRILKHELFFKNFYLDS